MVYFNEDTNKIRDIVDLRFIKSLLAFSLKYESVVLRDVTMLVNDIWESIEEGLSRYKRI